MVDKTQRHQNHTRHSGRSPKLRLWNNTMVNCLPVKSESGLAGLPMG
ncbi:hypothetical protein ACQ3G7_01350 [Kosakonia oryzendophytica]